MQKDRKVEKAKRIIAYPEGYPGAKEVAEQEAKRRGDNWGIRGVG
jgi:hypothetical protein